MSKNSVSGVAPEIVTALPRADAGAIEPGVAALRTNLSQGSFGYAISLQTPPDRGGSQPPLALEYDPRRNGNDAFGMGWGVAIPFIERRTDRGFPHFVATDRFAISDLGPIEPVGGGEFRPLVERDFRRIRFIDPYWEITNTDGTILTFGDTAESRLFDPADSSHVSMWYLARFEDLNGNITRYRYRRDLTIHRPEGYSAGQLYPHQIEYVLQANGDPLCAVRFDYDESRPDAWTSYRTGFPIRTNWLCRQVVAFTSNIDGQPDHVLNFGGVAWDVGARDAVEPDLFLAHGVYIHSSAADRSLSVEWPIPVSQARLALAVPPGGARYRITETTRAGVSATREENAVPGYAIVLGASVQRVEVMALAGPLVVNSMTWPGALVPEIYSRYRLSYSPIIGEGPVNLAQIAPSTRLLGSVERAGYDDARQETRLPPMTMSYQSLSVVGTFPRALRGTPVEALGAQATPLSFFGTGRPDLLQTTGSHRVFLNRGRIGAEIAVDRVDLVNSPSTKLGDADVFLRDINGRGAVDLTTTAFYYKNPSSDGPVSRIAPTWGSAVAFDPVQRHPQLSPTELQRSRSVDLDGDGQIDLLVTGDYFEEWTNLGGGSWTPALRIPRQSSFGDKLFPDVSFDDAAIFIADMNGDGRDEIVRVSARKVEYWARSSAGWTFKTTMSSSPRYADFDPARVMLADFTGNGTADLVYLTGNGIDLVVNIGGTRFALPIRLDFTDEGLSRGTPMPTSAVAALAVDLLGDGTRGVLWSFTRTDLEPNYFYLPLSAGGRPCLLSAFENGSGGRVELSYSTSSVQAAEDDANGRPWTDEPPYPVTVVSEVREIDRITGTRLIRRFRYRDGYYDRDDRNFRGFVNVEETVVGTSGRRDARIMHVFASGKPSSSSPEDKALARAAAGAELTTVYYDLATGALLRRVDLQVETSFVRAFAAGAGNSAPLATANGNRIAFTWERRRLESSYEGTTLPRRSLTEQSRLVMIGGTPVLDNYGRVFSETTFGEVVVAGAAAPVATFVLDGVPIALRSADLSRQRQTTYTYAEGRSQHLVRHRATEVTRSGAAFDVVIAELRRFFDGGTAADDFLPAGQVTQGNLQREERLVAVVADVQALFGAAAAVLLQDGVAPAWLRVGTTADGRAAWFAVESRKIFQHAAGRIQFGAVVQNIDAAGNAVTRTFDNATWYLRREQNALNHLTDHQAICYRAGSPRLTVLPNGTSTASIFDPFGKAESVTEDAANVPMAQTTTRRDMAAFAANGMPTSQTVSQVIDNTENPVRHVVEVTYSDGWGRVIQTRRSSQSNGNDFVAIDRRYDAGGQEPSFESLPYFSPGSAYTAPPVAQSGVRRYRDALARVIRIVFSDGREARLDQGPWQITVSDPEDADAVSPNSGTPMVFTFDFSRRVTDVSTTVRDGNGPGTSAVATTRYTYDAADRLVRIVDAQGTTTTLSYDARGDLQRLRHPDAGDTLRLFDANRHCIYQRNGAGEEWCYVFDAIGRPTDDIPGADPTQAAAVVRAYDGAGPGLSVGQLVRAKVVADRIVTQYTYEGRGHVTNVTRTIAGAAVASDTMVYDDLGEVRQHQFTGGAALEWTRGLDGLLSSIRFKRADGTVFPMVDGIVYHPSGRVAAAQVCGGVVQYAAAFDAATHRLASRSYLDVANAPFYRLSNFVYDGVGNIRSYREDAPPAGLVDWTLAYDSLYRLRSATAQRGPAVIGAFEYHHDLASNVTRSDETAMGQTLAHDPVRPDLLTSVVGGGQYQYDGAGRIRATPAVSNVRWNNRDRVDRLANPGSPQLDILYDHNRDLLAIDSTVAGVAERSYYFSTVHERHGATNHYMALLDGLQAVSARDDGSRTVLVRGMAGSIARTIDDTGAVIAGSTELYGPFGASIEVGAAPWPRGYAGAIRAHNGIYFMGARPYIAGLGQFGGPDPVLLGPLADDLLFDPRRISPFSYALGNPLMFVDPSGRLALIDDTIFYVVGWATGLRNDSFLSGVGQNFVESWSVLLRTVLPFHNGTTLGQVAAYPVQLTWGLPNELIGTVVAYGAVELFGGTTEMREHIQLITIPGSSFGAFTIGNKVIGDPSTLASAWKHEQGHYFQNLLLGPLYWPIIAIPSLIHAGLHPYIHPGQPYEDFYTETWATAWGK